MTDKKLTRNRAKCESCGDVIESKHGHDYVTCSCGKLAVDGGLNYSKRVYRGEYTDMNEYEGGEATQ